MSKGIDIEKAMSILSGRVSISDGHSSNSASEAIVDQEHHTIGDTSKRTIDTNDCSCSSINTSPFISSSLCGTCSTSDARDAQILFYSHCADLSLQDKLNLLFQLQTERVQTYTIFDSGLQTILSSDGNLHEYTALCTNITATFSVLSDSINTISSVLEKDMTKRLSDSFVDEEGKVIPTMIPFIKQLQQFEKEKLHLTAALHLEKIRIHAHCESENFNDGLNSEQQMTTYRLLNASKEQLMKSIATVVQHINEIMEELHGLVADL
jgi:hypothetical protein